MRHAILGLISLVVASSYGAAAQTGTYNRDWWLSSSKDQRTEFLAGYSDCSFYDAKQTYWKSVSWNVLEVQITEYLSSDPQVSLSLFATIERLAKEQRASPSRTGEQYSEKHGIFDGQYWFEATSDGRLAFVEGYEACQITKIPSSRSLRFSPEEQVRNIDRWYGLSHSDPNAINDGRRNTKIADVLARFED